MLLPEERIRTLMDQGLSDYQARAYLTLLEYPSCTVAELSKVSRIPRNRLYEVLTDLQADGLVHVHLESPRRYRANPLADYLERRLGELDARKRELRDLVDRSEEEFQPPPLEKREELHVGQTRVLTGRRAVAREVERLLASARKEVAITASSKGAARMLRYLRLGLERRDDADGLAVRFVVPTGADVPDRELEEVEGVLDGGPTRVATTLRQSAIVVDERELLLIQAIPEDHQLRMGEDFAILTTNPALLYDYQGLLRLAALPDGREPDGS